MGKLKRTCSFVPSDGTLKGTENSHSLENSSHRLAKVLELLFLICMDNIVTTAFKSLLKAVFLKDVE